MFVNLLFRGLSGWLQERFGVDIQRSQYTVDRVGASDALVYLKDVAFRHVLWRAIFGQTLPFTVHSGKAQEVRIEVTSEDIWVHVTSAFVRVCELPIEIWADEAAAFLASQQKKKLALLSGGTGDTEFKKWVRGRFRVSVTNLRVVLQAGGGRGGVGVEASTEQGVCKTSGMTTLVVLCSSLTISPPYCPSDEVSAASSTVTPAQSVPDVAWPTERLAPALDAASAEYALLAKDVIARSLELFICLSAALSKDWLDNISWEDVDEALRKACLIDPSASLGSTLECRASYREWTIGAVNRFKEAEFEARRTIRISARAIRRVPQEVMSDDDDTITLKLDEERLARLMDLFVNFDSFFAIWSAVVGADFAQLNTAPSLKDAAQYMELRHRLLSSADQHPQILEFEHRWAPAFSRRLRGCSLSRHCKAADADKKLGWWVWSSDDASGAPTAKRSFCIVPSELSPPISSEIFAHLTGRIASESLFMIGHPDPNLDADSGNKVAKDDQAGCLPPERLEIEDVLSVVGGKGRIGSRSEDISSGMVTFASDFAAETAYRVFIPNICVCVQARVPDHLRPAGGDFYSIVAPRLAASYIVRLASKRLTLDCHRISMEKSSSRDPGATSCILDWRKASFALSYFGVDSREISCGGSVDFTLMDVWPLLFACPGLRPVQPISSALRQWVCQRVDEASPFPSRLQQLLDMASRNSSSRKAPLQFDGVDLSEVIVRLRPSSTLPEFTLPDYCLLFRGVSLGHGCFGEQRAFLREGSLRSCCDVGLPSTETSVVLIKGLEVLHFTRLFFPVAGEILEPMCVKVERLRVNLAPLVLRTLVSNRAAYLPARNADKERNIRQGGGSGPPRAVSLSKVLMDLDFRSEDLVIGVWGQTWDATGASQHYATECLRCRLDGLRVATKSRNSTLIPFKPDEAVAGERAPPAIPEEVTPSSTLPAGVALASLAVELNHILGDSLAPAGATSRSVFVCSGVESDAGELLPSSAAEECGRALSLSCDWRDDGIVAKLGRVHLNLSPTPELYQHVVVLLPGLRADSQSVPHDQEHTASLPIAHGHRLVADFFPSCEALLQVDSFRVSVYLSNFSETALLSDDELAQSFCARRSPRPLCLRIGLTGAQADLHGPGRHHEPFGCRLGFTVRCACILVAQPLNTYTRSISSRAWLMSLEMIEGVLTEGYPSMSLTSASPRVALESCSVSISVGDLLLSVSPGIVGSDEPRCALSPRFQRADSDQDLAPFSPMPLRTEGLQNAPSLCLELLRPFGVRKMVTLLSRSGFFVPGGLSSQLSSPSTRLGHAEDEQRDDSREHRSCVFFALNGASVAAYPNHGSSFNGFFVLEPRLSEGRPVYRNPRGECFLYKLVGNDWVLSPLSEQESLLHRVSCDSSFPLTGTSVVFMTAPLELDLQPVDHRPVVELQKVVSAFLHDWKVRSRIGHTDDLVQQPVLGVRRDRRRKPTDTLYKVAIRLFVNLDLYVRIEVADPQLLPFPCPVLRFLCVSESKNSGGMQSDLCVCEMREVAVFLIDEDLVSSLATSTSFVDHRTSRRSSRGSFDRCTTGDSGHSAAMVRLGVMGVSLRLASKALLRMDCSVVSIYGDLCAGGEKPIAFLQPSERGPSIKLRFEKRKCFILYVGPMFVRLRTQWITVMASFVSHADLLWAGQIAANKVRRRSASSRAANSAREDAVPAFSEGMYGVVWQGPVWLWCSRPTHAPIGQEVSDASGSGPEREEIVRAWMYFRNDRTLSSAMPGGGADESLLGLSLFDSVQGLVVKVISHLGSSRRIAFDTLGDLVSFQQAFDILMSFQESGTPKYPSSRPCQAEEERFDPTIVSGKSVFTRAAYRAVTTVSDALTSAVSPLVHRSISAQDSLPLDGVDLSSAADPCSANFEGEGLMVNVEVKGLELWVPEARRASQEEFYVGLLLAGSAQGTVGQKLIIGVPRIVAVRAPSSKAEMPAVLGGRTVASTIEESIQLSFAQLFDPSNWLGVPADARTTPPSSPQEDADQSLAGWPVEQSVQRSPEPAPFQSPSSARSRGKGPHVQDVPSRVKSGSDESVVIDAEGKRTFVAEDQLMSIGGCEVVALWEGSRIIGVRLQGIAVQIPLDLLGSLGRFQSSIQKVISFLRRSRVADETEDVLTRPHEGMQMEQQRYTEDFRPKRSIFGQAFQRCRANLDTVFGRTNTLDDSNELDTMSCASSNRTPNIYSAKFPEMSDDADIPREQDSEHHGAHGANDHLDDIWELQVDVQERIHVTLAGGLVAPSHWLAAVVSNVFISGPVVPQAVPLRGFFTCSVNCYDARSALLEPVLEPVEISVIAWRPSQRLECGLCVSRLNINVQRVLVDFVSATHRTLRDSGGEALAPIRSYSILNETGVAFNVLWPQCSVAESVMPDGRSDWHNIDPANRSHHSARIDFFLDFEGLSASLMIVLDYRHSRAYSLKSSGCPVVVEPQNNMRSGHCTLRIQSSVTIYNHSALDLSVMLDPHKAPGAAHTAEQMLRFFHPSYGSARTPRGVFRILPCQCSRVPVDWFSTRRQTTSICPTKVATDEESVAEEVSEFEPEPELVDAVSQQSAGAGCSCEVYHRWRRGNCSWFVPRLFTELSNLIYVNPNENDECDEYHAGSGEAGVSERTKFTLFFHRHMKLFGYINGYDVPQGDIGDEVAPKRCFTMHLTNVVSVKNMLPFPAIFQIATDPGALNAQPLPAKCAQEALDDATSEPRRRSYQSTDSEVEGVGEDLPPCFCLESEQLGSGARAPPRVRKMSQMDGLLLMTLGLASSGHSMKNAIGRGVHSNSVADCVVGYVLGVDEELSLPLAKRSLYLRLAAYSEFDLGECDIEAACHNAPHLGLPVWRSNSICISQCLEINLPSIHKHKPKIQSVVLTNVFAGSLRREFEVSLEMTRGTINLFAPLVLENLTPCALQIHPEDTRCVLPSMSRRVCPRVLWQAKDTAWIAMIDFENDSSGVRRRVTHSSMELTELSDILKVQQLSPVGVPKDCPDACGFFRDTLSLGVCVRLGAPPLRITKVVSIFQRIVFRSELEHSIFLHLCKDVNGDDPEGMRLEPGARVPVHPPSSAEGSRVRMSMICEAGTPRVCSEPFPVDIGERDEADQRSVFHVAMVRADQRVSDHFFEEPTFIKVDICPATVRSAQVAWLNLQGKEGVEVPCGGRFVTVRQQDFRSSDDALLHVQNRARLPLVFQVGSRSQEKFELADREELWVHERGLEDADNRYKLTLKVIYNSQDLAAVDLGTAITARVDQAVAAFRLSATLRVRTALEDSGKVVVSGRIRLIGSQKSQFRSRGKMVRARTFGRVVTSSDARGDEVKMVFEDCTQYGRYGVYVVDVQDDFNPTTPQWLSDSWGLVLDLDSVSWKEQLYEAAGTASEVELSSVFDMRHEEDKYGVNHFVVRNVRDPLQLTAASSSLAKTGLCVRLAVPVLSLSWVHLDREVLALKVKGIDVSFEQELSGVVQSEISAQHLQIDHFMDSEMPVMLNRRFLHMNSRWLGKKALSMKVRILMSTRTIQKWEVEVVPYWLNLELGVLIRLWDLAESSFDFLGRRSQFKSHAVPLVPPRSPQALGDDVGARTEHVWSLKSLVMNPIRLTVHVRSPDLTAVSEIPTARWIMRLPADMPNLDMFVPRTDLRDRYGSPSQLVGTFADKYKRRVTYYLVSSLFISYLLAILKALSNAFWWLLRGPYDALSIIHRQRKRATQDTDAGLYLFLRSPLWMVSPLAHGMAEGSYRALAELVGNTAFAVVLILNAIRHLMLGLTRPRASSILDGLMLGFRGLVHDTTITPVKLMIFQTQLAYQDWGPVTACFVFCLTLILVFGGGLFFGLLNLAACVLEGLANILLHDEAQFASFEPQRSTEPAPLLGGLAGLSGLGTSGVLDCDDSESTLSDSNAGRVAPRALWFLEKNLQRARWVTRAMMDEDEVMDIVTQQAQNAFRQRNILRRPSIT